MGELFLGSSYSFQVTSTTFSLEPEHICIVRTLILLLKNPVSRGFNISYDVSDGIARLASVSNRVIARKLERKRSLLSPPPPPSFLFLLSSQLSRRTRAETLATQASDGNAQHLQKKKQQQQQVYYH